MKFYCWLMKTGKLFLMMGQTSNLHKQEKRQSNLRIIIEKAKWFKCYVNGNSVIEQRIKDEVCSYLLLIPSWGVKSSYKFQVACFVYHTFVKLHVTFLHQTLLNHDCGQKSINWIELSSLYTHSLMSTMGAAFQVRFSTSTSKNIISGSLQWG